MIVVSNEFFKRNIVNLYSLSCNAWFFCFAIKQLHYMSLHHQLMQLSLGF